MLLLMSAWGHFLSLEVAEVSENVFIYNSRINAELNRGKVMQELYS